MNTKLTIINKDLDLTKQHINIYLRPLTSSHDWEASAWQSCAPEINGSSTYEINNDVSAYVLFDGGKQKTREQKIEPGKMSAIITNGNEICLDAPQTNKVDLEPQQCGVNNTTAVKGLRVVWSLNGSSVCRTGTDMYNDGVSSFELMKKVYFTIGNTDDYDTFRVQNWTRLQEIDIPSNLVSADVIASLDPVTNKVKFELANPQY